MNSTALNPSSRRDTPRRAAVGFVLSFLLAGLATAQAPPAPQSAPVTPPAANALPPQASAPVADDGSFVAPQRITFREAIDRTLASNNTVLESVAEVLRAEALIRQTRAVALPQVNAAVAQIRNQYASAFAGVVFQPYNETTASGTLTAPLVNLVYWANWAHAIDNRTIAQLSVADAKRRVAQAAANAYLTVVARRRVLEANQLALSTAKAHFDIAHQRLSAGAASRLEEVQAVQDVSNDEVLVETSTLDLRRAQEALGVLLTGDGPFDAADEPVFDDLGSIADAVASAEQKRADVAVLAMREAAAEHVLRDSWRDWVPALNFQFQELYQNPPVLGAPGRYWQAQLQLSIPIFDGGLRRGERDERAALVKEAQANLAGGKVQARSDVRIANDAIRLADRGLESARNAARQAHDALDITNLSYSAGASTSLDVLDAQRRARDADTSVATAEDAARQARLDFLVGSGRFPQASP